MEKIKIFSGTDRARLENAVNKFLQENSKMIIVKDFKFSTAYMYCAIEYSILINYYERCEME